MNPLFSRPPPCPECGTTLTERHWPAVPPDEDVHDSEPEGWTYHCPDCQWEIPTVGDRLTLATAPWTAPVVAAVLEVVDDVADEGCGTPEAETVLRDIRERLAGRKP